MLEYRQYIPLPPPVILGGLDVDEEPYLSEFSFMFEKPYKLFKINVFKLLNALFEYIMK